MNTEITAEQILDVLKNVMDPDLGKDIVTLGFVKNLIIEEKKVSFDLELTTPACPLKEKFKTQCKELIIEKFEQIESVEVKLTARPQNKNANKNEYLTTVKNTILVSSGKGGVGKSTVSVNIALALAQQGAKVGLMDADAYGPSFPTMLNINEQLQATEDQKIIPAQAYGVSCVSLGFIIPAGAPVIWRGPMLDSMLKQFMKDVMWGDLDYLIIDLPPGTGDVQLTLSQLSGAAGAVVVTTPQKVALDDVTRNVEMFNKTNVEVLGIVENMSTFVCPHCGKATEVFAQGGGSKTAKFFAIPLLGKLPLNPEIVKSGDIGVPIMASEGNESIKATFTEIAKNIVSTICKKSEK